MMVSSYFANVGVKVDRSGLRSATAYFKSIERTLNNFKRRTSKIEAINLRFKIDRTMAATQIQRAMNSLSKSVIVPIRRFEIKGDAVRRAINKSTTTGSQNRGGIAVGMRVSTASLSQMRNQVRQAMEGTVIRPRLQATMRTTGRQAVAQQTAPRGSGGATAASPRAAPRNPMHNPMMVGGGIGAFMRYGMFSLPLVGGVMGLNAMSETAREFRAQETGLGFAASMVKDPSKDVTYYKKYLQSVGDQTGIRESLLSRDFHQMLAGSAGTPMEEHLEEGFMGLTQYAAILGLSDENMRLVMRGVTQMIGKGKIQA